MWFLPWSFAMGAWSARVPGPTASHCQPRETTVNPLRRKPGVAGVVGEIFVAAVDERKDARKAAVGFSRRKSVPLPLEGSLGRTATKSAENSSFAILEIGGVFEVDDGFVVDVVYGDGEKDFAGETFRRAGVAERLASENVGAEGDLDAR